MVLARPHHSDLGHQILGAVSSLNLFNFGKVYLLVTYFFDSGYISCTFQLLWHWFEFSVWISTISWRFRFICDAAVSWCRSTMTRRSGARILVMSSYYDTSIWRALHLLMRFNKFWRALPSSGALHINLARSGNFWRALILQRSLHLSFWSEQSKEIDSMSRVQTLDILRILTMLSSSAWPLT